MLNRVPSLSMNMCPCVSFLLGSDDLTRRDRRESPARGLVSVAAVVVNRVPPTLRWISGSGEGGRMVDGDPRGAAMEPRDGAITKKASLDK